ncbi:MAG: ATP-binding protein [Treponema sp.]|nr:ATP-binding protein [Treponema sp.]MCL2237827.1 ATP-binding protein [Treponema sp.]
MQNKKNSILVVDDERDNISSLKIILSPEYKVYASTKGKDAIETAHEFLPDIILLDVLMPDMDGYDVITALKNSEKTRDIPVIFITGLDNSSAEIKGLALGAADYILKPFHPAIVKLRVQHQVQLVERHRQQTLMTKIAHNFLVNSSNDELYTGTLKVMGEFIGNTAILLYKLNANQNVIVCQNEWMNPAANMDSRIGTIIKLTEESISDINNLLSNSEKELCLKPEDIIIQKIKKSNSHLLENFIATPIYIKGRMNAILVLTSEDKREWSESETGLIVLAASIFSGVFERNEIQHNEYLGRVKTEFLSRMSHEMRTPLNAIMGILQVFDLLGVPENLKENCSLMNSSARTLLRLIDDVLDISDMEYGMYKLANAPFDFKLMAREILRNADENASKKNQILDCKIDPAIPASLIGDEKRLRQVINTFLSNAVKFTAEEGEIFFDARLIDEENEIVTLQIEITDNGIGISKEQQDKLFSVFEQGDGGLTRDYDGLGIGLALSKRIIDMMGGNIRVESQFGKGSKFNFTCKFKR